MQGGDAAGVLMGDLRERKGGGHWPGLCLRASVPVTSPLGVVVEVGNRPRWHGHRPPSGDEGLGSRKGPSRTERHRSAKVGL